MKEMILYRPVGQKEYELIRQSDFTAFPPRLPEQLSEFNHHIIGKIEIVKKFLEC